MQIKKRKKVAKTAKAIDNYGYYDAMVPMSPAGVKAFSPLMSARRSDQYKASEKRKFLSPSNGRETMLSPRSTPWIDLTKGKLTKS